MSYNPREAAKLDVIKSVEPADVDIEIEYSDEKSENVEDNSRAIADEDSEASADEYEEPYDFRTEELNREVKRSNRRSIILDLTFYVLLIFVCIYIIPNYVIQRTVVDGTSMEDTLYDKDQLYVEKISYHFDVLKRFDIIVFYPYGREYSDYYVKRIIGLPGETVQIVGSDIYIDGKPLKEQYGKDPITDPGRAENPIKLADDEYFVLGDNRSVSVDSRSESVGNVKQKNIGGRVIIRIKPLSRFGPVD